MKSRIIFFLRYYIFWIVFFLIQKPIFMLWQHSSMTDIRWYDCFAVMWHGLPLDLSVAAYITVLPALLLIASAWVSNDVVKRIIGIYSFVIMLIAWLVIIADNGTFPSWGFRIDKTVFFYLVSPKEVIATAPWWMWLIGLLLYVFFVAISWLTYKNTIDTALLNDCMSMPQRVGVSVVMLLLAALLFLPIRGSLTVSTMNTGRVYYSPKRILNLAAINPVFNLIESLSEQTFDTQRYTYMPSDEAIGIVRDMTNDDIETDEIDTFFTAKRPDIVLIIWESMSANAWEALPCTHRIAEQGIWFTRAYASSFRTDRGVVAALSGFPGQPTSSLMTAPGKTKSLNYVSNDLHEHGYQLHWYYGGDEDFTNMRSYLTYGGFNDRVCDKSFPVSQRLSKWGVPDHILLNYAASQIRARKLDSTKHFDVILTLSSHEPFEVQSQKRFDNPYLNSMAYTDSCVGAFVDSLRQFPRWDSTLIVIMGDHGFPHPAGVQNHEPRRYALPIIFAGGAVRQPQQIDKVCSQIDWIPTVLYQLGAETKKYIFAKNVLSTTAKEWAFYSYNDGWGLITPTDTLVYDRVAQNVVLATDSVEIRDRQAKALVQTIYEQIDSLSLK